ncbi:glutamate--tRNA ligase [Syntrophomonas palmitatica]|uniref:glutamate--tRNA ligase n=1 Tax=Syntrophomonas palmitatica TaxID=402877 RepID=UPI0006D1F7AD|nr:glutamate--tRNA ligase [Syntrophomonas palmitatica]
MSKVKVRFAPSPTGPLHIGGARSALFNYLFAAHEGGEFVLRIEDTDLERSRLEYETEIIESLKWLGIKWTEGMEIGGENAPYRQTERLDIYKEYAEKLLQNGQAYYCFCSEEELENERWAMMEKGEMPRYSGKCRHLSQAEIDSKKAQGMKPTLRFRVPSHNVYVVDDLVRGKVSFESKNEGDFIIMKSDGLPTYNFAVVIDDVLMGITHVIRAEEHLSNTPRQLMIYDALNLKRPEFAHISLIMGSDRQKMSKRHGATSLIQYREMGYLPEALFNFLALLGWSPEGEKEILSHQEIIEAFNLERVAKSPAVFDLDKLNWLNQQYIRSKSISELESILQPFIENTPFAESIKRLDEQGLSILIESLRDRITSLSDVGEQAGIFFLEPSYEGEALDVLAGDSARQVLEKFQASLPFFHDASEIKQFMKTLTKELGLKPKDVFMPVRCALTGSSHGPDLAHLLLVWGREESLRRVKKCLDFISNRDNG